MSKWLTRAEVAERLGIHINSLFRLEQLEGFPVRSEALRSPRWREDEIDEFMEKGRNPDPAEWGRSESRKGRSRRQRHEVIHEV